MTRRLLIVAVLILGCASITIVLAQVQEANRAAAYSTAASVLDALRSSHAQLSSATGWHVLGKLEYDATVAQLVQGNAQLDVGGKAWSPTGVLVDPWGNRLQIAARHGIHGKDEYLVWSNGSDGVAGTSDDIVAPPKLAGSVGTIVQAPRATDR